VKSNAASCGIRRRAHGRRGYGRLEALELVKPWSSVQVVTTFVDNLGTYVIHCHNLEHEDHSMMAQFQVVP
jgi:FtsP/CotA-like multicopper oxidase with cupredoxin domain